MPTENTTEMLTTDERYALLTSDEFYHNHYEVKRAEETKKRVSDFTSDFRQKRRFNKDSSIYFLTVTFPYNQIRHLMPYNPIDAERQLIPIFEKLMRNIHATTNRRFNRKKYEYQIPFSTAVIEYLMRDKTTPVAPHIHALVSIHDKIDDSFQSLLSPLPQENRYEIDFNRFNLRFDFDTDIDLKNLIHTTEVADVTSSDDFFKCADYTSKFINEDDCDYPSSIFQTPIPNNNNKNENKNNDETPIPDSHRHYQKPNQ